MMLELCDCTVQFGQGSGNVRVVVFIRYQISITRVMMESLPGAVANSEGSISDFDFRDKALRRAFIAAEV